MPMSIAIPGAPSGFCPGRVVVGIHDSGLRPCPAFIPDPRDDVNRRGLAGMITDGSQIIGFPVWCQTSGRSSGTAEISHP